MTVFFLPYSCNLCVCVTTKVQPRQLWTAAGKTPLTEWFFCLSYASIMHILQHTVVWESRTFNDCLTNHSMFFECANDSASYWQVTDDHRQNIYIYGAAMFPSCLNPLFCVIYCLKLYSILNICNKNNWLMRT